MKKKHYATPVIRVFFYQPNKYFLVSGGGSGDDWHDHDED